MPEFNGVSLEGDLAAYFEILDANEIKNKDVSHKKHSLIKDKEASISLNGRQRICYARIVIKRKDNAK